MYTENTAMVAVFPAYHSTLHDFSPLPKHFVLITINKFKLLELFLLCISVEDIYIVSSVFDPTLSP